MCCRCPLPPPCTSYGLNPGPPGIRRVLSRPIADTHVARDTASPDIIGHMCEHDLVSQTCKIASPAATEAKSARTTPRRQPLFSLKCVLFLARKVTRGLARVEKKEIKSPNTQAPKRHRNRWRVGCLFWGSSREMDDAWNQWDRAVCSRRRRRNERNTRLYPLLSVLAKITVQPSCIEWSHVVDSSRY
ncbi:hypothetical protein BJY01DRAFT_93761 [Aspergillus pseudoustus]|uniref:Uncharacterized protein n=1 Tax=Aspergillus pseudoustus TaxID=1810923 RepID=A0ABR4IZX6_9EURO